MVMKWLTSEWRKESSMAARQEKKDTKMTVPGGKKGVPSTGTDSGKSAQGTTEDRHAALKEILLEKREALIKEIKYQLGQSVTEEQSRRLEAAMDSGDQALVDLDREMGISLQEMRNRERQLIDDALDSLEEGTYGVCAECGNEISEKRLQALPFARLCVECKSKRELMEKIERSEQRQ
jgi:DnaK suppressor protein